jgi:large subunit ribosomal protein L28
MAFACDICGKRRLVGNKVSHSNRKSKTTQQPNIRRVRAVVDGTVKHICACTRCLRSGKVVKAG